MEPIKSAMERLLKKQEEDRMGLAANAYNAWQSVRKREKELLIIAKGSYELAAQDIKKQIDEARIKFYDEWGAEGKLAAIMTERHEKERQKLVERESFIYSIKATQDKKANDRAHSRGRGR